MWFKIDDSFYHHPKWLGASDAEMALWVRAGAWCARYLTDGQVPTDVLGQFPGEPGAVAEALVKRGLWERWDDGFRFHDWADYQPSREQVQARRESEARRQELSRNVVLRQAIRDRDRDTCRYCGRAVIWGHGRAPGSGTYDHVDPHGGNDLGNLVVACMACNARKGSRAPSDAGMTVLPEPYAEPSREPSAQPSRDGSAEPSAQPSGKPRPQRRQQPVPDPTRPDPTPSPSGRGGGEVNGNARTRGDERPAPPGPSVPAPRGGDRDDPWTDLGGTAPPPAPRSAADRHPSARSVAEVMNTGRTGPRASDERQREHAQGIRARMGWLPPGKLAATPDPPPPVPPERDPLPTPEQLRAAQDTAAEAPDPDPGDEPLSDDDIPF